LPKNQFSNRSNKWTEARDFGKLGSQGSKSLEVITPRRPSHQSQQTNPRKMPRKKELQQKKSLNALAMLQKLSQCGMATLEVVQFWI